MYTENIEKIISSLINYAEDENSQNNKLRVLSLLGKITKDILIGNDYILFKVIKSIFDIKMYTGDNSVLEIEQESMERIAQEKVLKNIFTKEFNLEKSLIENDLGYNAKNPKDVEEIKSFFCTQISDSIENIYNQDISTTQAVIELDILKNKIVDELFRESICKTSETYNIEGIEKSMMVSEKYREKIDLIKSINIESLDGYGADVYIGSYEDRLKILECGEKLPKELYKMGFEPYDKRFSITTSDIVVVAANPNVGKTRFMIDQVYKAITSGVNVSVVPTETPSSQLQLNLELAHLYNLFGYMELPYSDMLTRKNIEEPVYRAQLEELWDKYEYARRDLWDNKKHGKLHIKSNIKYEECLQFFAEERNTYKSDLIVIDHVKNLGSSGAYVNGKRLSDKKEQLSYLMESTIAMRISQKLSFLYFVHLKSVYSNRSAIDEVGVNTNIAASASEISEGARRMFLLDTTLSLEQQDKVIIYQTKDTYNKKCRDKLILRRAGSSNVHLYLQEDQEQDNSTEDIERILS